MLPSLLTSQSECVDRTWGISISQTPVGISDDPGEWADVISDILQQKLVKMDHLKDLDMISFFSNLSGRLSVNVYNGVSV